MKRALHLSGDRMLQKFDFMKLCHECLARPCCQSESLIFTIFSDRIILAAARHPLHMRTVRDPSMNRHALAHLARTGHARYATGVGRLDARHEHRFAGDGQGAQEVVAPGFGRQKGFRGAAMD